MGSGADYYRDRHVVVTGGTGALGTAMVGALLEAGAARARRCLKFCEIAGIKADGSAQDWASLYQQRIGQQTSTGHGAVPARSSARGLANGREKPSPP
jgi:NAD(P)-dependent dehydrogenase (short-subunit alcohol dehydrogenase family)